MADVSTLFGGLLSLIVLVVIAIGVFLICREIVCWYFKINRIADDLSVIADHYRSLKAARLNAPSTPPASLVRPQSAPVVNRSQP